MNTDAIAIGVGYAILGIPFYFGIRAPNWLPRLRYLRSVQAGVESIDQEFIRASDICIYEAVAAEFRRTKQFEAANTAAGNVQVTIRSLREHRALGKKIAAAEHVMEMWRTFGESIADTWFDGLIVGAVIILAYLLNSKESLSENPWAIVEPLRKALKELWLPIGEIILTLFAFRAYSLLKKQTSFYAKELGLH